MDQRCSYIQSFTSLKTVSDEGRQRQSPVLAHFSANPWYWVTSAIQKLPKIKKFGDFIVDMLPRDVYVRLFRANVLRSNTYWIIHRSQTIFPVLHHTQNAALSK